MSIFGDPNENQWSILVAGSLVYRCSDNSSARLLQNDTGKGALGTRQWGSGVLMAAFLDANADSFKDKKVVELGSGIGLASIVLGRRCPQARIVATDKSDLMPLLNKNIDDNFAAPHANISCKPLLWGTEASDDEFNDCNVVIGADLTYDIEHLETLLATVKSLCRNWKDSEFILAYSKERYAMTLFWPLFEKHFSFEHVDDAVVESLDRTAKASLQDGDSCPDFEYHTKGIVRMKLLPII